MCALRWYIKSLYRHLFLVDISKHARVTQRRLDRRAPKLVWGLLKHLAVILTSQNFFPVNPPLSYGAEKRRDHRNCVGVQQISVIPPHLSTITKGGFTGKKKSDWSVSQLSALATLRPIWGRVGQGAIELSLPQIRKCHFFEWPLRVWIYLLRKDVYRDFLYIILSTHNKQQKLV